MAIRCNPSRLGRIFQLFGIIRNILTYVYVCVVFKQLLVIGTSESLRLKRLVAQTINKSRRLRIKDQNAQQEEVAQSLNNIINNNLDDVDLALLRDGFALNHAAAQRLDTLESSFDS